MKKSKFGVLDLVRPLPEYRDKFKIKGSFVYLILEIIHPFDEYPDIVLYRTYSYLPSMEESFPMTFSEHEIETIDKCPL